MAMNAGLGQSGWVGVGSRSFRSAHRDLQSLAELGFIVIELDAMGTPMRSKSFHEAYYGNMGDNGLPDQIAGIRQLGARHSWIDVDQVGIYGHSGGGFASTDGILRYPDFYKVAVSQAGNHDNRNYEDDWGEKWQGLLEEYPDGTTNYDNQANQLLAKNLKGKLLIAHGTLDSNVPPSNTMLVVDALIAANKDFVADANDNLGYHNFWLEYALDHAEGARDFVGLKWFRDHFLPAEGHVWATDRGRCGRGLCQHSDGSSRQVRTSNSQATATDRYSRRTCPRRAGWGARGVTVG